MENGMGTSSKNTHSSGVFSGFFCVALLYCKARVRGRRDGNTASRIAAGVSEHARWGTGVLLSEISGVL